MNIEELTGSAPDENCLHCFLPPIIQKWMTEHPRKNHTHAFLEVCQVAGDLAGSALYNAKCTHELPAVLDKARAVMQETAEELIDTVRKRHGDERS